MILSSDGYKSYNVDDEGDCDLLIAQSPTGSYNEVWERDREKYGYCSPELLNDYGIPGFDMIDRNKRFALIDPSEYKQRIEYAHAQQVMPMYHTYKWRPKGFKYNQNSLGYCWTWSGTGAVMTCRALEDKEMIHLSPVSMGYLVGWANRGNYLSSFVKGAREDGICPGDLNSQDRKSSSWPMEGDRKRFRLDEVWDLNDGNMIQQCVTTLCSGRSIYIAYNWWGHALELVGLRYNGSTLEWIISNSHNEDDFIILTGSRATPSEGIAIVSTKSTEASPPELYLPATAL